MGKNIIQKLRIVKYFGNDFDCNRSKMLTKRRTLWLERFMTCKTFRVQNCC